MPGPGKELPPFAPPSQETLNERINPEGAEAKETAEKIAREKLPDPKGFTVNHDVVGPWTKGQRISIGEVKAHLGGREHHITDQDVMEHHVNRLVSLGALVPHFE